MPHAFKLVLGVMAIVVAVGFGVIIATRSASSGDAGAAQAKGAPPNQQADNPDVVHLEPGQRQDLGIDIGKAVVREVVKPIDVPGTVGFDDRLVTHLRPRTGGRVLTLAVGPGDRVAAGAVLATLDASSVLDARKGFDAAVASLEEATAARDAAAIALKRAAALLRIGGVAKAEVENRQVQAAKAEAEVRSAQAQVDFYKAQYERLAPGRAPGTSAIVSPIGGVVVSAHITLGEVVDTNQDVFTVADPSKVIVLASVFGFDIGSVEPGDRATIQAPTGPHERFQARVRAVDAALDPMTNAASARLEVDNPHGVLKANMFVGVEIEADLGRRAVAIPAEAVQESEQGPIAFVQTAEDTFVKHNLKLGLQRPDWVEVEDGVKDGETVATKGSFGLKSILMRSLLGSTD